ncbi:hypothetical protein ACFPK9_14640 [Rubritalea spongiae]
MAELQQCVDANNLLGGWVQKGRGVTHVTEGLDQDIALRLSTFGVSAVENYKGADREVDSLVFGYTNGTVLLIKLKACLVGFVMASEFPYLDELVEGGRRMALKATLELLQAPVIFNVLEAKPAAEEEVNLEDSEFTRWDEFIDVASSELTRVLHASQVDIFIRRQLKGIEPRTVGEARQAANRIAEGIPDKSKKDAFRKIFEENVSKLTVN